MKSILLLLVCLAALMAGCSTVGNRIEEKSAFFNSLDAQTQTRLKQGIIGIGDASDMVYIAIGRPDRIKQTATANGQDTTWIYTTRWEEYQGTHFAGYDRRVFYNRRTGGRQVYYEPVRAEYYQDRVEEYLRVNFKDGKVTAIEQTKQ